jgi:predicted RNA-binding Zn ribbon-like protein
MSDSLAVRFANTRYAQRGEPVDVFATVRGLRGWLSDNELTGRVSARDVATFQELREAARRVLGAVTARTTPPSTDVAALNRAAAAAPIWPELVVPRSGDGDLGLIQRSAADPVPLALARLAGSVIELVTGDRRDRVHACGGPGCVMFFEQTRERRVWQSGSSRPSCREDPSRATRDPEQRPRIHGCPLAKGPRARLESDRFA